MRRSATAVLAALAVTAIPLAGAGTAVADGTGLPGTVSQVDGVPTVAWGDPDIETDAGDLDYEATLPASVTGDVKARVVFPSGQFGTWTPQQVARSMSSTCFVTGGPDLAVCRWSVAGPDDVNAGSVILDMPTVPAAAQISYDAETVGGGITADLDLHGTVELRSAADNSLLASNSSALYFRFRTYPGVYPALYGRDESGVLWKYNGTGDMAAPFGPRTKVGGGWDAYTAITPLGSLSAGGYGDLVARDTAGVLWYYQATYDDAKPFKPRVRVGSGWNTYTALAGGGLSHTMGLPALVARDADGKIWYYEPTGDITHPFAPRVEAGHGWNIYSPLVQYADGLVGRDSSGGLWAYDMRTGSGPTSPYGPRVQVGGGWQDFTALAGIKDANLDGADDLVARDSAGKLWLYRSSLDPHLPSQRSLVGGGWNTYDMLF
ncbi:hypothetical protein [Streptomyces sp. NBC_01198]|uniref:hypothetical protein n=1 Tax=Streptomyces sp. NBC_01198 TaxID=2903769 RepID=UPI002E0EE0DD|nr:hypothetical protein OG702_03515 [Streptomyces sp. NBC_01198]